MPNGYSWSDARHGGTYRLPGPEHLGWWAAVAMLVSILLHVAVFFALDRMKFALHVRQSQEISTEAMNVQQVEVRPAEDEEMLPPENLVQPTPDTSKLMEEIELLAALPKNTEIDIKPETEQAEYALQMKAPAMEGDPAAVAMEASAGLDMDADLPELGRSPDDIKPAAVGQLTVDPGSELADDNELGKFTEDLIKKGAGGKVENGKLDGVATLDEMLDLPSNILLGKKTLLPSDLLFEFNKSELRESAKVGLMKLALLMDRNPELYCWIEGHTDLIGGDEFNLNLSVQRAESVKSYLVNSMRMDASKIYTRGFGRYEPLVITGSAEEQSLNRRVEIKMRKTPPTKEQMKVEPKKAAVIEEAPAATPPPVQQPPPPSPPKAILVKPKRALPVEENPPAATPADGIVPLPGVPKATPVEPGPPRAQPVEG
jgi:outer membrane protein OmpA-like peptidoglycan-associated protein